MLAARLLVEKGVREFVEAAYIINRKKKVARFVLVGNPDPGNPSSILKREIQSWQENNIIEWWGKSEDIQKYFQNAILWSCLLTGRVCRKYCQKPQPAAGQSLQLMSLVAKTQLLIDQLVYWSP